MTSFYQARGSDDWWLKLVSLYLNANPSKSLTLLLLCLAYSPASAGSRIAASPPAIAESLVVASLPAHAMIQKLILA